MDELLDLKARLQRLHYLYEVSNIIGSTLDSQEALQLIVREAVRLMNASSGSVALINPRSGCLEIQASLGLPTEVARMQLNVGEGITGWVAQQGQPVCLGDVISDPRYVMARPEVRSELAVPLEVAGEVRGVINVDSEQPHAFDGSHLELLQALAVQAARVIHNTWLYEQIRVKARLFESLLKVGQTINSSLSLEEVLQVITREACQLMSAKMSSLLLLDGSRQWLDLYSSYGAGPNYINKPRLSVDDSLLGVVLRRRKPLQVENVQLSGQYQHIEVARTEGLVSLLSVPLIFNREPTGTLNVYTPEPYLFSNEEVRILSALADLSALAIERARLHGRIVAMEEELRQNEKLSALGLLAAEVAHEIRNPLTVLKMLYHSLDLKFPESDPRSRDVQIMSEKMDHLNRIVEQILDFARSTEPQLRPVQPNEIASNLGLLVRHKLQSQKIELRSELAPSLPTLLADGPQLEQAMLNVILNAVEAMPEGGILTIATRQEGARIAISIGDTGAGMTESQRAHAFTSLLSTTKARGTGLGLAIVKRVMDTHGGDVRIESQPGAGTRVTLLFPIDR